MGESMIFVDTGVWYSLLVPKDPAHQKTAKWFDAVAQPILTSEDQFRRSWLLFQRLSSAGLSFTDCTSHVVADDLGIRKQAKNAGTVPGYSTSKISNHHSTITNPPLVPPACQRLPKSVQKRGDCPRFLVFEHTEHTEHTETDRRVPFGL